VNADTVDMGEEGARALAALYGRARDRKLLDATPDLDILQV
jgi:predicted solute-binding protein